MTSNLPVALPAADEVHAISIDLDLPGSLLSAVSGTLSESEKQRANRLGTEELRRRFIAVHGILRLLLGRYLGTPPEMVEIRTGQYGKPYTRDIEFSVSHSRSRAVMAFSRNAPVGVDVEMMDAAINLRQVALLAFSPAEFETWQALPAAQQQLAFYQVWTAKEALLKALGAGMRLSPRKFTLRMESETEPHLLAVEESFTPFIQHLHLYHLNMGENTVGSLVVVGDGKYELSLVHYPVADVPGSCMCLNKYMEALTSGAGRCHLRDGLAFCCPV